MPERANRFQKLRLLVYLHNLTYKFIFLFSHLAHLKTPFYSYTLYGRIEKCSDTNDSAVVIVGHWPGEVRLVCDRRQHWEQGVVGLPKYSKGLARSVNRYSIVSVCQRVAQHLSVTFLRVPEAICLCFIVFLSLNSSVKSTEEYLTHLNFRT